MRVFRNKKYIAGYFLEGEHFGVYYNPNYDVFFTKGYNYGTNASSLFKEVGTTKEAFDDAIKKWALGGSYGFPRLKKSSIIYNDEAMRKLVNKLDSLNRTLGGMSGEFEVHCISNRYEIPTVHFEFTDNCNREFARFLDDGISTVEDSTELCGYVIQEAMEYVSSFDEECLVKESKSCLGVFNIKYENEEVNDLSLSGLEMAFLGKMRDEGLIPRNDRDKFTLNVPAGQTGLYAGYLYLYNRKYESLSEECKYLLYSLIRVRNRYAEALSSYIEIPMDFLRRNHLSKFKDEELRKQCRKVFGSTK